MSDTLSSLIAFVGFLIVFAMLVQAMQEGLKNVLKLKAGVWERFVFKIYEKEVFINKHDNVKLMSLFERIKLADSVGDFGERLRRLREAIAYTDEGIQKLKGLLSDVINLSTTTAGDTTKPLDGPNTRDKQETEQLLLKCADIKVALNKITGLKLDSLLEIYDKFSKEQTMKGLFDEFRKYEKKYLTFISSVNVDDIKDDCQKIYDAIVSNEKMISEYRLQIDNKIDAWLSQINEEYRKNMLKWTVIIGTAFVLLFNADAFSIYKYISHDSKIRDSIIKNVTESAAKMQHTKPEILNKIDTKLKANKLEEARKDILDFSGTLQEDYSAYGAKDKVDGLTKMIVDIEKLPIASETDKEKAKAVLEDSANKLSLMYAGLQKSSIDYQIGSLSSLDLPLGWTADFDEIVRSFSNKGLGCWLLVLKKVGGLFMTSFLITFGAPFWNDILSTLVGIKNMSLKKA